LAGRIVGIGISDTIRAGESFFRPVVVIGVAVCESKRPVVDRLADFAVQIVIAVNRRGGTVVIAGERTGSIVGECYGLYRGGVIGGRKVADLRQAACAVVFVNGLLVFSIDFLRKVAGRIVCV
jgi:hypothetical protein